MGPRRDRRDYCYAESKPCTEWVQHYFKDCLCNLRDDVSFGFGLFSVSFWGFAEVPQIITNFKAKSCQGVSILLLMTWILGDVFNLAGCILEPSTLPTQFYTALLYTMGSFIIMCQCIYYDYIVPRFKKRGTKEGRVMSGEDDDLLRKGLLVQKSQLAFYIHPSLDSGNVNGVHEPYLVPMGPAFYTSARSLATSPLPYDTRFSNSVEEQRKPNTPPKGPSFVEQTRGVVNTVAGYGTLVAAAVAANLPGRSTALNRTLLNNLSLEDRVDPYGQLMGWGMAVVYISGRFPQIWLNIKRGNVDGLSPCMFVLALIANITYVLSILVRSCKWVDIKANMPWLLDSIICISLDLFILLQFVYYRYKRRKQYIMLAENRHTLLA